MIRGGIICSALLKIERRDIPKAASVLAQAFAKEDPLYQHILPDETTRLRVMNIFFHRYVEMLYPYCDLLTTSDNYEAVALVFHSEREAGTLRSKIKYMKQIAYAIITSLPICRIIGIRGFVRGISILLNMSSSWLSMLGDKQYMHLDMLVVQEQYRGQGYVTKVIKPLLSECRSKNIACTLETQTISNLPIYEHYQFRTVKVIALPNSSLEQYCMVYAPPDAD
ncbi:GNAT family N-acetyltransferase [Paenibacillus macquariensis]|uniref:Acetyltransferase (GNAT) domain-containing protein n=1 Tax=Paenibacillus macquariensis TaxID=948756 RepID=A0ABY1JU55_9BACL|nr:GNAT family N-acetyltransferase [Paenibacillus macquariensis]MEC0091010.1 GNAT family N-acetyltransferase [Paenibacillus macquariensis]SIQ78650.1 Acetyltransferase (GNAT) domain-containing protein [Paenibacillus macquariensis]